MADVLQRVLRSLPHGPEFRFLDRMLSLTPATRGVGEYRIRGDEWALCGDAAGQALFPAMLLVEAGAQVAGLVAQEDPLNPNGPRLKLTALRSVDILGSARPGETLRIEAVITGRLGDLIQAEVTAFVADTRVLTADLTLSGADGMNGR